MFSLKTATANRLEKRKNIIGFILKNNKSRPWTKVSESRKEKPSRDDECRNGN